MAGQSGAVQRLRGFRSPEALLGVLMPHVARGFSLRETVVRQACGLDRHVRCRLAQTLAQR